jgi:DNA polymerase III subunit gamma/tau
VRSASSTRWTVTVSNEAGEPTLADQGRSAETDRRAIAHSHPLVQAILAAFPGATIETTRDAGADDYGLPLTAAAATAEPDDLDGRDFAPPEADSAWSDDELPTDD